MSFPQANSDIMKEHTKQTMQFADQLRSERDSVSWQMRWAVEVDNELEASGRKSMPSCPELNCIGFTGCALSAIRHISSHLNATFIDDMCRGEYSEEAMAQGCNQAEKLRQEARVLLSPRWQETADLLRAFFLPVYHKF